MLHLTRATEKNRLKKAFSVIEEFRKLDPELQLNTAIVFLVVAASDGPVSMMDLSTSLGLEQSTLSRIVSDLTEVDRFRNEKTGTKGRKRRGGFGLVKRYEDPIDRRFKLVELTAKGRAVRASLEEEQVVAPPLKEKQKG